MKTQSLIISVVIISVLWAALSWYWYVCGIKGFCDNTIGERDGGAEVANRDNDSVRGNQVSRPSQNNNDSENVITSTEEIEITCSSYLKSYIRLGYNNNAADVTRLQEFLNTYENESLEVNGVFGSDDEDAVKRFQLKYKNAVMVPWGMTEPSGFVFKTTRDHINTLKCALEYAGAEGELQIQN